MRYISLFSGIESASAAWEPMGWAPVCFSEIEPFPRAVLSHRFPDVPLHGDMTGVDWHQYQNQADVVVAGAPCQAFSVAGARQSLDDDRGNLTLRTIEAINAIHPEYIVFEREVNGIINKLDVRRLAPTECERLQGFSDGWTQVPYRNKLAADGPRYKALGNAMAVPVMRWLGEQIGAQ